MPSAFDAAGKYDEIGSKSGHGGGDREGGDPNIAMLEKEHEEITKVIVACGDVFRWR